MVENAQSVLIRNLYFSLWPPAIHVVSQVCTQLKPHRSQPHRCIPLCQFSETSKLSSQHCYKRIQLKSFWVTFPMFPPSLHHTFFLPTQFSIVTNNLLPHAISSLGALHVQYINPWLQKVFQGSHWMRPGSVMFSSLGFFSSLLHNQPQRNRVREQQWRDAAPDWRQREGTMGSCNNRAGWNKPRCMWPSTSPSVRTLPMWNHLMHVLLLSLVNHNWGRGSSHLQSPPPSACEGGY